jgi:hypothetical protein
MSDNEEIRVKVRHDVAQFYQREMDVSRREMPRGVMTISGDPNPDNSDDDIEDNTYVPSPELVLMEKGWLVQVVAGQGEMMNLRKRLRK